MNALRDMLGREFKKGQMVGVAVRSGNVAIMRTALVEDVHESEGKVSLRWTDNYPLGAKISKIAVRGEYIDRPRMVVIG